MLDLDVGFLADPKGIVKTFYETPEIDIFVQVFKIQDYYSCKLLSSIISIN